LLLDRPEEETAGDAGDDEAAVDEEGRGRRRPLVLRPVAVDVCATRGERAAAHGDA